MSDHRKVLAVLLAPLAAPALAILIPVVQSRSWPFHYEVPVIVFSATLMGYGGFFLIGLPSILLLRRFGWLNFPVLIVCGALSGIIVFNVFLVLLSTLLGTAEYYRPSLSGTLWGMTIGASVAALFGLIAGITSCSRRTR